MNTFFVLGNPIEHSKSPQIHQLFAQQTQQTISYNKHKIPLGDFTSGVNMLIKNGMNGCNVTVPFKQDAWEFADQLSPSATLAEAVNTLVCEDNGTITGHNTDGIGLVKDLSQNHNITLKGLKILIAGAGGAARGILQPLLEEDPSSITISNRTHAKAQELAGTFQHLGPIAASNYSDLGSEAFDLIINATSTSLDATIPPIPESCVNNSTTLYDLMYQSEPTSFLVWGKSLNSHNNIDGLGMLIEQAAESFYLWTGVRPNTADVIKSFQDDNSG